MSAESHKESRSIGAACGNGDRRALPAQQHHSSASIDLLCRVRTCSEPPRSTKVAVRAFGHPVNRLYRSPPTCQAIVNASDVIIPATCQPTRNAAEYDGCATVTTSRVHALCVATPREYKSAVISCVAHGARTCCSWNCAQVPRAEGLRPLTVVCTCAPVACATRCRSSSATCRRRD